VYNGVSLNVYLFLASIWLNWKACNAIFVLKKPFLDSMVVLKTSKLASLLKQCFKAANEAPSILGIVM
jgi:hypothetical protein